MAPWLPPQTAGEVPKMLAKHADLGVVASSMVGRCTGVSVRKVDESTVRSSITRLRCVTATSMCKLRFTQYSARVPSMPRWSALEYYRT